MGKAIYIGDENYKARKVKKIYIGGSDGKAHKVKKIYIGDANGKARLAWSGEVPAGQVIFTSSQVWTVPDGVSVVDVFLVGGGASGDSRYYTQQGSDYYAGGYGGSSGFTTTYSNISVTPNSQISVVIGAGGTSASTGQWAKAGGSSSFGGYSVKGCAGGVQSPVSGWTGQYMSQGGSGGGIYGYKISGYKNGKNGASDGADCKSSTDSRDTVKGQGTTTRAFGESTGTLYAGGGGGGSMDVTVATGGAGGGGNGGASSTMATSATPNTGGGGGGSKWYSTSGAGGSGIVIVRWKAQ